MQTKIHGGPEEFDESWIQALIDQKDKYLAVFEIANDNNGDDSTGTLMYNSEAPDGKPTNGGKNTVCPLHGAHPSVPSHTANG